MPNSNANESAFPYKREVMGESGIAYYIPEPGLTKREYFAAMVTQGILASGNWLPITIAKDVIIYTDLLLKQLEETK